MVPLHGPHHGTTLEAKGDYAIALEEVGNYAAAESLYLAVAATIRQHHSEDHREYIRSQANLADLYRQLEAYNKALPLAQEALARERETLGPDHLHVGASMVNVATLLMETGDFAAADTMFEGAVSLFQAFYQEPHPQTGMAFSLWGFLAIKQKAYVDAETRLREGLSLLQASLPLTNGAVLETQAALGALYLHQNRPDDAAVLLEAIERFFAPTAEHSAVEKSEVLERLVEIHLAVGNTKEAQLLQALPYLRTPIDTK